MTPLMSDVTLYFIQFIAMTCVVLFLEFGLERRIVADGHTVWAIVWAVAQVGLLVLARLYIAPIAGQTVQDGAISCWVIVFWSFVAAAIPVIAWTQITNHQQVQRLIERRGRGDN